MGEAISPKIPTVTAVEVKFDDSATEKGNFIPARPKASGAGSRGVNANPKMEKYIFGEGSLGVGYYHMSTRDGCQLVDKRLSAQIEFRQRNLHQGCCCFPPDEHVVRQRQFAIESLIEKR